jgi:predicted RecB family nuclease
MSLTFSPSDLSSFLACTHLAALDLRARRKEVERPHVDEPQAELIRLKGIQHEDRYLESLRAPGLRVASISFGDRDWRRAAAETADAIASGVDVVYQACLVDAGWRGFADFVERQADGSYEVVDTKLGRHPRPGHVFQLCFYSAALGNVQGHLPRKMHLVLGDGRRETFAVADYDAYYRRVRDDFVRQAADGFSGTAPYPCAHCPICSWRERCESELADADHLSLVAAIRRTQVDRLVAAGITTLTELGDADTATAVPHVGDDTFAALREQASLQLHHRRTGEHRIVHLAPQELRGFQLLPPPSAGDVYYDIEGDPFYSPRGSLEYLHGVSTPEGFRSFWAVGEDEEQRAFEELVDFLVERRRAHPEMHVYHYANYERAALQRLMQKHGSREDEVDELLRGHVLVDLYQVVRQALRLSLPSYSLKKVEALYFAERTTDVLGGEESTVAFERYLESGDGALLDAIEAYNKDDCDSTMALHAWLLELRPDVPWAEPPERKEPSEEAQEHQHERERVQAELRVRGETLLADLLDFHRRDVKPAWWDYFRYLRMDERELVEDSEAIGAIEYSGRFEEGKHSNVYELEFPPQEFKIGGSAIDPATEKAPGTILSIDENGVVRLRRGKKRHAQPFPRALVPPEPLTTTEQRRALLRLARRDRPYRAARDILARAAPRANLASLADAALSLDESYLFVQGPPGTGKTWRGAAAAIALMQAGKRVGIAAQSHKAIHKFLDDVVMQAGAYEFRGVKKTSEYEGTRYDGSAQIANERSAKVVEAGDHQLVAGTSWLFAREKLSVDVLFIDEAGQVSLADALAMATCASSVVLLGDPNQLPQVTQGAQPPEVRASVLEHLLGPDERTVRPDRGIFIGRTWRLRPELCEFVSRAFYDGRLEPEETATRRSLAAGNGLRFVEVPHTGNAQRAPEEADWIGAEIRRLLGSELFDGEGTRALTVADVLVVAPYNMQVRCIRGFVPEGVAVGTVDRFQGQQAAVVFFSMTSSSGTEVPRGLEFLFSPNRFNVAISRAQCLAYVVASPALLLADARTPEQMRLLDTVCRFAEEAP